MDGILREVQYTFVYLDDILVASPDQDSHRKHLRSLFSLLADHGVSINQKKCVFGERSVKYLGNTVSKDGIAPLASRVEDMISFPPLTTKLGLQQFLGMVNCYRRFVPRLARALSPLHAAVWCCI